MFALQNEIFVVLRVATHPLVLSLDPFLRVLKSHLVSFSSKRFETDVTRDKACRVWLSERTVQLSAPEDPDPGDRADVSVLANRLLLQKRFSSLGLFVRSLADR